MKTAHDELPQASIVRRRGLIGMLKPFKTRAITFTAACLLAGMAYALCRTVVLPALHARAQRVQSQYDQFLAECEAVEGYDWRKTYPNGRFDDPVANCLDYEGYVLLSRVIDTSLLP